MRLFSPATLYIFYASHISVFGFFFFWSLDFTLGQARRAGAYPGTRLDRLSVALLTRFGEMSGRSPSASLTPGSPSFRPGTQLDTSLRHCPSAPANSLPSPPLFTSLHEVRQLKLACVCSFSSLQTTWANNNQILCLFKWSEVKYCGRNGCMFQFIL